VNSTRLYCSALNGAWPTCSATGFHGFHVLVGSIFLAVCLFRAMKGHFTPNSHFGFEAAAWYWHFVDVVWLFLFTAIYWWGNS
jgi:cytochrome c oxidase subunit 3